MITLAYLSIAILISGTSYVIYKILIGAIKVLEILFIPGGKER